MSAAHGAGGDSGTADWYRHGMTSMRYRVRVDVQVALRLRLMRSLGQAGFAAFHPLPCLHTLSAFLPRSQGLTMAATLQRLGPGVELSPMQQSAFVKPHSVMFSLDGRCGGCV